MLYRMIEPLPAPLPPRRLRGRNYNASAPGSVGKKILCFIGAGIFSGMLFAAINDGQLKLEDYLYAQISEPMNNVVYATSLPKNQSEINLAAKSALSLRIAANGREHLIYQKKSDEQMPIASLTKLMTATVILESPAVYDFDKQIVVSQIAARQDDVPSFGNLKAGEVYSVRQLLGLMLHYSSNDAAWALSESMGETEFVAAMNRKAADLGLDKTVFYNPHGLDLDNGSTNLSSADNMLLLVRYILKNHPEIFSLSIQSGPYVTENGIFNLKLWDGQNLVGGKTGYTEKAGGCMIIVFDGKNQRRYINILLAAESSETRVVEMQKLINYTNNSDI